MKVRLVRNIVLNIVSIKYTVRQHCFKYMPWMYDSPFKSITMTIIIIIIVFYQSSYQLGVQLYVNMFHNI